MIKSGAVSATVAVTSLGVVAAQSASDRAEWIVKLCCMAVPAFCALGAFVTTTYFQRRKDAREERQLQAQLSEKEMRPTVLIVDDHHESNKRLSALLYSNGFVTLNAYSVDEAMGILDSAAEIDSAVVDLMLPSGMSGLEIVDRIKKERPHCSVVIWTAGSGEMVDDAKTRGVPVYTKPVFDVKQMLEDLKPADRHHRVLPI